VYEIFPRLLERRQNMGNQLSGGEPVIVVEQHARLALSLTERTIVLDRGRIVHDSDSASLLADGDKLDRLVSVA
jgi:branched-chain amino acid transport system ATP-binding protein